MPSAVLDAMGMEMNESWSLLSRSSQSREDTDIHRLIHYSVVQTRTEVSAGSY